eukprot:767759-Prorocentrum_lima.AAC.1
MTSSLVGSEMCIRDRGKKATSPGGEKGKLIRGRKGALPGTAGPNTKHPVSDRHLTLPTIWSV